MLKLLRWVLFMVTGLLFIVSLAAVFASVRDHNLPVLVINSVAVLLTAYLLRDDVNALWALHLPPADSDPEQS